MSQWNTRFVSVSVGNVKPWAWYMSSTGKNNRIAGFNEFTV
jgi:hypothetical protein